MNSENVLKQKQKQQQEDEEENREGRLFEKRRSKMIVKEVVLVRVSLLPTNNFFHV